MTAREVDLIEAVQPIRGLALATSLQHFFSRGLFDLLVSAPDTYTVADMASKLNMVEERLKGLLRFLRNEGFVENLDGKVSLSNKAHRWSQFRAWYEMMVGGYAGTFMGMGDALAKNSPPAARNGALVGSGSCGISMHDAIPIVHRLLAELDKPPGLVVDLGCGSGAYLTEICRLYDGTRAIGIDPDAGGCSAAKLHVEECGMSDRIEIVQADAIKYIKEMATPPDLVLLCFVVHEVLGQDGEEAVMDMLKAAMSGGPNQRLIIIDIDHRIDEPAVMHHQLAQGYYNAYFLLHPFTSQRLESQAYWDDLFKRCGFEIEVKHTTDPTLDSTNIELGWMLRRAQ